ncbi:MAG TPA: anaerobic ribonucleoside-triphosphate reductase activating protein [Bacillota bacterium]|jgi:anaerobic ribonucleoside-triphosphate reductase activating protein|nr:anaerobic ribonucleoside-triphosphate reductase activating protein [Bacillota bacterium]
MSEIPIRFAGITEESVVDGPGLRSVIFFQGCPHHCRGCHNPETWDFAGGSEAPVNTVWEAVSGHPLLQGITLSGGEPFAQPKAALYLASQAKKKGWDVMVFTGYTWEKLIGFKDPTIHDLLDQIDLLVDGRFMLEERDLSLRYRGSRNQRIIDLAATKSNSKVTCWEGA